MVRLVVAACGLAILFGGPSWADAPSSATTPLAASAPADAATAEREALARRFFIAAHIGSQINTLLNTVMPVMVDQEIKGSHKVSADDRANKIDVSTVVSRQAMADIMPEYLEACAKIYAKVYTSEELQAMVSFYEGPLGQSILAKNAQVAGPVTQVMVGLIPKLKASLHRHYCEHVGCEASDSVRPHGN